MQLLFYKSQNLCFHHHGNIMPPSGLRSAKKWSWRRGLDQQEGGPPLWSSPYSSSCCVRPPLLSPSSYSPAKTSDWGLFLLLLRKRRKRRSKVNIHGLRMCVVVLPKRWSVQAILHFLFPSVGYSYMQNCSYMENCSYMQNCSHVQW